MPITTTKFILDNVTPTRVVDSDNMPHQVTMHNRTKSSNEYIYIAGGSADAAGTTGIHLDPGDTLTLNIPPGDELWAISTPDGLILDVLDIRRRD